MRSRATRRTGRAFIAAAAALSLFACRRLPIPPLSALGSPPRDFAHTRAPAAPNYADLAAWLVHPARPGPERERPEGDTVSVATAPAVDVFFVHPTTFLPNDRWNAPFDARGTYEPLVLRGQVTAFAACCRVYAPRYRQATLGAQVAGERRAIELAYGDVERAFDYWLAHENQGRPFVLASYSQGTLHALRLLETRIANTPLQRRLVAAYLVGHFVPPDVGSAGVPICETAAQGGCLVSWNSAPRFSRGILGYVEASWTWDRGRYVKIAGRETLCVNPLVWRVGVAAPADSSKGALPPEERGKALGRLAVGAVSARCDRGMLVPAVRGEFPRGLLLNDLGHHLLDYNLYWRDVQGNVGARVVAFRTSQQE